MTPQEQQMIDGLISRVRSTPVGNKDAEAEQHIQTTLASFPDALYVLVQTVLVQQYGLEQAQSQIGELRQQVQTLQGSASQSKPSSGGGSFLSHLFGNDNTHDQAAPAQAPSSQAGYQPVNNPPYGNAGYPSQAYPAPQQGAYPPPPPYAPQGGYPSSGSGMFGGGGGGFLQGAMQTAAGVAAGEMVFRGMEDLFSGFGGGGGGRGFAGGGGGETIVENNYIDGDRDESRGRDSLAGNRDDSNFYNPSNDASREGFGDLNSGDRDASAGSSDFGNDSGNDFADNDSSQDFSSNDDGGGFDDGGSDFSGDNS